MRVLVIAPHQDDEVLGCGASLALLAARGCDVSIVHVFAGITGIPGIDEMTCAARRHDEAQAAAETLGVRVADNLGFRDRESPDAALLARRLTAAIRSHAPMIVFAPHEGELDVEHALVARAAVEARWMSAAAIGAEEGPRLANELLWLGYEVWQPLTRVSLFVDVTRWMNVKRRALAMFASQMEATSWQDGIAGLNTYRGTTLMGRGAAEAFDLAPVSVATAARLLPLFGSAA